MKYVMIYFVGINILTCLVFGLDKFFAIHKMYRIRISTFMALSILGGAIGGWVGMNRFHHKTRVWYFKWGLPVLMILQSILIVYMMKIM